MHKSVIMKLKANFYLGNSCHVNAYCDCLHINTSQIELVPKTYTLLIISKSLLKLILQHVRVGIGHAE